MKVLILEKFTSFEIVSKRRDIKSIPKKRFNNLKRSHDTHEKVKDIFLSLLNKNKINYSIVKEIHMKKVDCSSYDYIISLGGDGTFLHAASIINNVPIIGINTDITKSYGFLTKFNHKSLDKVIEKLKLDKPPIEVWNRLCVRINNVKLDYLGLNEILIASPKIYTTTHLKVEIGENSGDFIGNGIVISTKKGSTAFYKSSGGVPFSIDSLGYSIILPFKADGNLETSCVLEKDKTIIVRPKRSGYKLLFDCDEKRSFNLNQEDKVEIKIDPSDGLRVII